MKKIKLFVLLMFCISFLAAKTFIREYTYQASEADSKITSRAIALEQVKRLLLEELGVYVHSTLKNEEIETSGEVKELTARQIEIISAGITETKIIEETWNGEIYYIKAEIIADENDVIKRLDAIIADKEKTKQLEDSHRRTEKALTEIERLKTELAQTQDENEKLKLQKEYNNSSNELTVEDWFQKGVNSQEIGENDNAILYYQRAIKINPDPACYYNIGLIYYEKSNLEKSIEYYLKAIELCPEYFEAYNNLGVAYKNNGNHKKAIECYLKAIELCPDFSEAYNNLGVAYRNNGNHKKAIECYQQVIKINPDDTVVYLNIGNVYYNKGNYNKAIKYYQKAIKINPNDANAYFMMGRAYHFQEISNYNNAIECYQKAIEINPDYADAYFNMGIAYGEQGNDNKAIECWQKAARLGHKYTQDSLREMDISW